MKNQSDIRRFTKILIGTGIYMLVLVLAYVIFKVIKNDSFAFVIVFIVSCIIITGIFLIILKIQSDKHEKRQEEYYQNWRNMTLKRLSNEQFQPVILNNTDILFDDLVCKAKMGEDGNVICIIEAKVTMELSQDDFLKEFSIQD
ncbi:MAG: hypothetical protein J5507_02175 [Clostridia bacterium]|nr:hypothetical protein [Clostridia bacterium]